MTPDFIEKYRILGDELQEFREGGDSDGELRSISDEELKDAYRALKELIETYDRKNADNIIASLKCYSLPGDCKTFFDRLKEYLRKMDWENARKLINKFGGKL